MSNQSLALYFRKIKGYYLILLFVLASGLAALVSMLGIFGVWVLKNFVDGWIEYN